MSSVTADVSGNGPLNNYTSFPGGFERSAETDLHYANIRRKDLMVVTRRIEPRSLPARDMGRNFNPIYENRPQYHSQAASDALQNIANILERPENTRRKPTDQLSQRKGDRL